MNHQKIFAVILLNFALISAAQTASANHSSHSSPQIFLAGKFLRTELYFGMNKPDGSLVLEEDWNKFLETEVTVRFPEGFTVLEGYGQYQDSSGKIVREQSRVLVLFYPKNKREAVNPKIEELRVNYKKQFDQESVLRLDFKKSVEVSF